MYFIDEVGVEGQRLRLGKSKDITSEEAILYVTQSEMTSVLNEAGSSTDSGATLTSLFLTKDPSAFIVSDLAPFSEGNLIKIDNEIMQIFQIQTPTTTLVVRRGYMGSAKQKHLFGTTIYNYDPTMTQQQLTALIAMGTRLLSDENFNNLSPIFHKQIDQHLGVEITFTFETTDNTEDGEMAYATVLRNSEVFAPHDGYGLA